MKIVPFLFMYSFIYLFFLFLQIEKIKITCYIKTKSIYHSFVHLTKIGLFFFLNIYDGIKKILSFYFIPEVIIQIPVNIDFSLLFLQVDILIAIHFER